MNQEPMLVAHVGRTALSVAMVALCVSLPTAQAAQTPTEHFVPSRPGTVSWGWFPLDKPPVLTIASGDIVRIDTLSHAGSTQSDHPEVSLGRAGITPDEILPDVIDFWASREGRPREGRSGHVITGPIAIAGAEAGDMLEIQILELTTRVPYGINNTSPIGGVFGLGYPGSRPGDAERDIARVRHVIRTGRSGDREVAFFADDIEVPLAPFMGIMAVAPTPIVGEPRRHGARRAELAPTRCLRRQHGREGSDGRQRAVSTGVPAGRPVLHRRSALGSG